MSQGKISALTKPVTVNGQYGYGTSSAGSNLINVGSLVSGHLHITVSNTPAGQWNAIGQVGKVPASPTIVSCSDTWNGKYAGLLRIDTSGYITVFLISDIPEGHTIAAAVNYLA